MNQKRKFMNGRRPTADGRQDAAFTLLELVMVVAIMGILVALLVVGVIGARRQAARKATQGRIAQLELAVQQFYDEFRVYPPDEWGEAMNPADGTLRKFMEDRGFDTTGFPTGSEKDIECPVYAVTVVRPYIELKKLGRHDADGDDFYEVWDGWSNPLHYDSSSVPRNNTGFVDIWSNGPDGEDDSGGGDDLTNWERH